MKDLTIEWNGIKIIPNMYVSDLTDVPRTWKERLFERPWKPFNKTKAVRLGGKLFAFIENTYFCSYQTYSEILKAIEKEKNENPGKM